jgi:hypothetical protein
MEPRIIRSDDFYKQRIAQLEADLRRAELGRQYAEDSSRRAWAMASWVRRPTRSDGPQVLPSAYAAPPPATSGRDEGQGPTS